MEEIINLKIRLDFKTLGIFQFPKNIKLYELKRAICLKLGFDLKNLLFEKYTTSNFSNDKIKTLFSSFDTLIVSIAGKGLLGFSLDIFGEPISIKISDKNKKESFGYIPIGLLNSNMHLIKALQILSTGKVKNVCINGKELYKEEERSLLSLGINKDCECIIEILEKID